MKRIILALTIILLPTACAPAPTPEPTPTAVPPLDEVYSAFIDEYYEMFGQLATSLGDQDEIKPIDLYFVEEADMQSLIANVGVVTKEQDSTMPFAYPISIISKIIEENQVVYPKEIDTLVINLVDDYLGLKYRIHTAKWSDFLDYADGKITIEQLLARMESEDVR